MNVHLFIPCFIDQFFPEIGKATVLLLEKLGVTVSYPMEQTCCGQPAFNTGYHKESKKLAKKFCNDFKDAKLIVSPSPSCINMVKNYHKLIEDDEKIGERTYELCDFLVNKLNITKFDKILKGRGALHIPCHMLRELKGEGPPIEILKNIEGLELVELESKETCCGFGGTFSVKFSKLSVAIGNSKIDELVDKKIDYLISPEASCLLHLGGIIKKRNIPIKPLHIAQILSDLI